MPQEKFPAFIVGLWGWNGFLKKSVDKSGTFKTSTFFHVFSVPGNSSFQMFLHHHGVPRGRKHKLLGQLSAGRKLSQLMSSKTLKMRGQLVKMVGLATLPETNGLHLKIDAWKTTFLLGFDLFSGAMKILGSPFSCVPHCSDPQKKTVSYSKRSLSVPHQVNMTTCSCCPTVSLNITKSG